MVKVKLVEKRVKSKVGTVMVVNVTSHSKRAGMSFTTTIRDWTGISIQVPEDKPSVVVAKGDDME